MSDRRKIIGILQSKEHRKGKSKRNDTIFRCPTRNAAKRALTRCCFERATISQRLPPRLWSLHRNSAAPVSEPKGLGIS